MGNRELYEPELKCESCSQIITAVSRKCPHCGHYRNFDRTMATREQLDYLHQHGISDEKLLELTIISAARLVKKTMRRHRELDPEVARKLLGKCTVRTWKNTFWILWMASAAVFLVSWYLAITYSEVNKFIGDITVISALFSFFGFLLFIAGHLIMKKRLDDVMICPSCKFCGYGNRKTSCSPPSIIIALHLLTGTPVAKLHCPNCGITVR